MLKLFPKTTNILAAALLGGALLAAAGPASAANMGTGGTVAANCQVTITTPGSTSLDLTVDNSSGILVGAINEKCNDPDGYTVQVGSQNAIGVGSGPAFMEGAIDLETLDYTIVYDFGGGGATDVALTAGNNTDVAGTKAKTGGLGVAISIGVKYDGTAVLLSPDAYSDTMVITVTAVPSESDSK